MSDSSSRSGLQPGAGKVKTSLLREWAGSRSGVALPYDKQGHRVGIRRGTLVLAVILLLAGMFVVNELVETVLRSSPTALLGGVVTLILGAITCTLIMAMVYALDVAPLKRQGVRFIDMEDSDDDYLRYVHRAVSSTPEWETLTGVASEHRPPSEKAPDIHSFLWDAAGIKPTLDTGEIRPGDQARLSEIALLARGL